MIHCEVANDIHILQITSISVEKYFVNFVIYLKTSWQDSRIKFLGNESAVPRDRVVTLGYGMIDQIWLPDLYIYNLKSIEINMVHKKFQGRWGFCSLMVISFTEIKKLESAM